MNTAIVTRGLAAALLFAGLSPMACGGDSEGGVDTSKLKGTGGEQSTDAGTPTGTGGASAPAGSIPCGEKNCTVPEGSMGPACCINHFTSECGISGALGGGCVKPPPPPPKDCPVLPAIGGVFMLRGCCTTGSLCGIDTSMFPGGTGCTDYAAFKEMVARFMGGGMGGMGGGGGLAGMFMITLPDVDPPCTPAPAQ